MIKRITLFWILLLEMPFVALAKDFLVVDFGAKGNGVTDDASAIQKTIELVRKQEEAMSFSLLIIHSFLDQSN